MIKKIFFIFLFSFVFSFGFTNNVLAGNNLGTGPQLEQQSNPPSDVVTLRNPLGEGTTFQGVIGNVIAQVLGVVGAIALLMFIYGGLTWMMAMGNDQSIKKGKDILIWSSIGLLVIFTSYALVRFVLQTIGA